MAKKRFYITTTLPYVNARLHIGHALEFVQADAIARSHKALGDEVFFNTGTDEHGQKIYEKALKEGQDPQAYVDACARDFKEVLNSLDILPEVNFIRTTDAHHMAAAREFWKRCDKNGDIYKKNYQTKYCVGCELEKTDSELVGGKCPVHPNLKLEVREEENYFFRFSKYQKPLLELYEKHPDFVVPSHRLTEIKNFVEAGLQDFSISRLKSKMPWGVPVPGDDDHVMYVWFDALVNYVSALGWPEDEEKFEEFWGTKEHPNALQIAGKDNLRQQSAMWQAMLLSAGLPTSRQVIIHGFVNVNGAKISKSAGNAIDLVEMTGKYGTDAVRFWLLHDMTPFEDGDFTWERFNESYNAHLANGLGNFAARVLTLGERLDDGNFSSGDIDPAIDKLITDTREKVAAHIETYAWNEAVTAVWNLIAFGDKYVNEHKPWENFDGRAVWGLVVILDNVAAMLEPFLPGTAQKLTAAISWEGKKLKIEKPAILFPRVK